MNFNFLKNLGYIAIILGFALFLSACSKKQSINFYRESKVKNALDTIKAQTEPKKDTIHKSSGIIIYKDNSYQNNSINKKDINFGPKDPNFDIKIRF